MPVLFALEQIDRKIGTVGGCRANLPMQPEPNLGTTDLGTRIPRRIDGVHVVHICTYLTGIGLRTNHPINRKIDEILPVDLPLGDAVARRPLTQSGPLIVERRDISPTGPPAREQLLLPQLGYPRRVLQVGSIFPEGNDLIPHLGWIRIPPPARMRLFLGPGSIRRADGWTMGDNIGRFKHNNPVGGGRGASSTVVSNRRLVAAVATEGSGAVGGGWSMRS